jgi:hypothetical protein
MKSTLFFSFKTVKLFSKFITIINITRLNLSNPEVKQHCLFNQFIAINDNQTLNLPSIYVKSEQVKWKGELGREGRERERQSNKLRERE